MNPEAQTPEHSKKKFLQEAGALIPFLYQIFHLEFEIFSAVFFSIFTRSFNSNWNSRQKRREKEKKEKEPEKKQEEVIIEKIEPEVNKKALYTGSKKKEKQSVLNQG